MISALAFASIGAQAQGDVQDPSKHLLIDVIGNDTSSKMKNDNVWTPINHTSDEDITIEGSVSGNLIEVINGTFSNDKKHLVAGQGKNLSEGPVENNRLIFKGGESHANIYGGKGKDNQVLRNNKVELLGGTIGEYKGVYGAEGSKNAEVIGNKVVVGEAGGEKDALIIKGQILGAYASGERGLALGNTVEMYSGTLDDASTNKNNNILYGAKGYDGATVESNKVLVSASVKGSLSVENVIGGLVDTGGKALSNEVIIEGHSRVEHRLVGAEAIGHDALVEKNTVTIRGNSFIGENVYGGGVGGGSGPDPDLNQQSVPWNRGLVSQNEVYVEGDADQSVVVQGNLYGGYAKEGNGHEFIGNTVSLKNVKVERSVSGAYAGWYGVASGNTVEIFEGTVIEDNVVGAIVEFKNGYPTDLLDNAITVSGNEVIMKGGRVGGDVNNAESESRGQVLGAYSKYGIVKQNSVTIDDGIIGSPTQENNVYGGYGETVIGNSVVVSGASKLYSRVHGGQGTTDRDIVTKAELNTVKISLDEGNILEGEVFGGSATKATENTVIIEGGVISGSIHGGDANFLDRTNQPESLYLAENNKVLVSGGKLEGHITGGSGVEANGNIIDITGGKIIGAIYGADAKTADDNLVAISGGEIIGNIYATKGSMGVTGANNKVVLSKNANVKDAKLWGYDQRLGSQEVFNTLEIQADWTADDSEVGGSVQDVLGFKTLKFNGVKWVTGGTILTITGGDQASLANTEIDISDLVFDSSSEYQVGDRMTFIHNGRGENGVDLGINLVKEKITFVDGVATVGSLTLEKEESPDLAYEITDVAVNKQVNIVSDTRSVAVAFLHHSDELISESLESVRFDDHFGLKTFATVYGDRSKYDVDSHLKINGWSGLFGVGNQHEFESGDLSWGVFFETGDGNFRTKNYFLDRAFRSDGDISYNGGGVAIRFDTDNRTYYELSAHMGSLKTELRNAMQDGYGNQYGYTSRSLYYGGHVGMGHIFEINPDTDVDVYAKYHYTYAESDDFNIAEDHFKLDSVNSSRVNVGARLNMFKSNSSDLYLGASWEYEFAGDSGTWAQDHYVSTDELQGSTYVGEAGWRFQREQSPWHFDARLRGYCGMREGVSGKIQATYNF